jgi:hypothetical protein
MKAARVPFAALLVTSVVALWPASSAAQDDPFLGTWVLDVAKSKLEPGPPPKDQTVIFEAAGEGVKITAKTTDADGSQRTFSYTGKYDGKDYPATGDPNWDMQSLKRTDANTLEMTRKRAGKVVETGTNVVSADGKTRTVTMTGVDAKGREINNTSVYEKQ